MKSGDEDEASDGLSDEDVESVAERSAGSAKVVHEVIRLQGDEELGRPFASLLFSGLAAGVAISTSMLAQAFLAVRLPDALWAPLVSSFGYASGFVIVIMGNLQLFTESTITAVLPIATHPTGRNLARLLRLWLIVFVANMAGTLLVAALCANAVIVEADQLGALVKLSRHALDHGFVDTLFLGMPAGFLVAAIAWILPNARGGEFWVVTSITYIIAIGGFSHVVVGSGEAWLAWLTGGMSLGQATGGHILPSLIGNIVGGTGLFAVVAHGQVRGEIATGGGDG
ncbi:formate/nitrite transporter family protein [Sphingomonas sp.]|uniref:formate/nitrite transporter family protein n=1 Tax=Sphingomonas sp. TaxID=28214 RepID=UPI003B00EAA7